LADTLTHRTPAPLDLAAPAVAKPPAPSGPLQGLTGELCVLILDESSADRFQIRTALVRQGTARYHVYECADCQEARDLVLRHRPDAVLLDNRLPGHTGPGSDGITCMQELAHNQPDAAFIIITRQGDEATAVRAMKAGATDYLVKDQVLYDPVRIDRAVQAAVYTKRLERENQHILETLRQRNLELERLNKKLWDLSHTDDLTGYFNRRYITSRLEEEIARSVRYELPLSIVLMDLDHFKAINDTYGHLAGDRALQTVAHLVRAALRDTDLIGRFGGEEFLLILTNTELPGAEAFCNRLRERLQHHPIYLGETVLCMTASFGVSAVGPTRNTSLELLRTADQNLYRAKAEGRNRVVAGPPAVGVPVELAG
jgi:diguanylate cyclase (GGDEF)-like protein